MLQRTFQHDKGGRAAGSSERSTAGESNVGKALVRPLPWFPLSSTTLAGDRALRSEV